MNKKYNLSIINQYFIEMTDPAHLAHNFDKLLFKAAQLATLLYNDEEIRHCLPDQWDIHMLKTMRDLFLQVAIDNEIDLGIDQVMAKEHEFLLDKINEGR